MERSKQTVLRSVIAAVLSAFLVTIPVRAQMRCSNYNPDRCTISNLRIALPDVNSLKFPIQEHIDLTNVDVDYLSPQVMERMKWVSKLTITNGLVGRIYLKPDLQHLSATRSNTFEIIIEAEQNADLEVMSVVSNHLRTVPENIENLKALTTLQLSGNKIEVLDMNKFHGFQKLASIDLSNNKLYYLAPVIDLELVQLKTVDLSKNYLTELDFAGWIMPRLQTLTLSSNRLPHLIALEAETFPSLQNLVLSNNLFDCRWWDQFSNVLFNITKRQPNINECTKSTQLSPATYRKLNMSDIRSSGFQFDNKDQLEEQINGMTEMSQHQSTKIESLVTAVAKQATQLVEANAKLVQQRALIDDLAARVESLYEQLGQLKELTQDAPVGKIAPKGLREKLIREISEVIRKNLPADE
ncbi:P-granule-associated novel protein 1-like [Ochlerotatus camptorhynchus]|uniref:P-granule-associated novel protein 1-like n=1 Tax=Ochlerotatus camptorhynchus TaxID=644619 RepID=UPI0031E47979